MSAINITEAAHDYLADLLSKQSTPGIGIRIFITQPGTQYAETCIAYCKPGEEKPEDTPLALKSFTAYIDAFSETFLDDAVVDYATDRMGGQLTIKAPNAKVPMVNADSPVNERITQRWGVRRSHPQFWYYFHDLARYIEETEPLETGVLDMNRYQNL